MNAPFTQTIIADAAKARHGLAMDAIAHLEHRVGDTPLVRCQTLADRTSLPNLLLKLEGTNPTGTQKDRIAHLEVKEAISRGATGITAASCGNYGVAVAHAAALAELPCTIFVPETFEGERVGLIEKLGATVERAGQTYEDAIQASRALAATDDAMHNANPGGTNTLRVIAGYGTVADEILGQLDDKPPAAVGVPIGNGTTLAGVHGGFRAAWSEGRIKEVPRMVGGSSEGNNPVHLALAREQKECSPLDPRAVEETAVNEPLVNWDALDGTACLTALRDSRGYGYGFDDDHLMALHDALMEDGFDAHPASLAAVAALQAAAEEGHIPRDAPVVAVLTSGRSTIRVERLHADHIDIDAVLAEMTGWLGKYGDPDPEIREAVRLAVTDGVLLVASEGVDRIGYTALTPMPFDEFFPKYHLSYICVSKAARGRGVGTLLMEEAIRVTGGDLSLHVETDNEPAIQLYKKFGFHAKYYRMLYKGPSQKVDPAQGSGWHDEVAASTARAARPGADETVAVTARRR